MTEAVDPEFGWEVMKVLLQIAWANDDVEKKERAMILEMAVRLQLAPHHMEHVERCLQGLQALPPPSITKLRQDKAKVQELAETVVMADDVITDEENAILQELHIMLYATDPPPTLPPLKFDE